MDAAPSQNKISPSNKMTRKLRLPNSMALAIYKLRKEETEAKSRNESKKQAKERLERIVSTLQKKFRKGRFVGTVSYNGLVMISQTPKKVRGRFQMNGKSADIESNVRDNIQEYLQGVNFEIEKMEITLRPEGEFQELIYVNNRMRDTEAFSLVNLYNNIININTTGGNCVPDTLAVVFPKIAKQKSSPIPNLKNANTTEIMEFCKKYRIRAIAYNIHKDVIAEHIPINQDKKYATLVYLYYNNHMYLIKNKYLLEKCEPTKIEQQSEDDLQNHFKLILKQQIIPSNIQVSGDIVTSFTHNDTTYFTNPDYDSCFEITKRFMFSDKIHYFTTLTSIMKYIEPLYSSQSTLSFLPIHHVKPAFYYNAKRDEIRPIITIDKNKAYSDILRNLPYLLSTDYRTYELTNQSTYTDEYSLYIATPKTPHILMPKQDIYSGTHIKFCKNKIEFTIQERLQCKKNPNHFKQIVNDLFTKFPPETSNVAKTVICRAIGSFQSEPSADNTDIIVVNKDDRNPNNTAIECDNVFLEFEKNNTVKNVYNRKPIAIQIKDKMNQELYEKMEELFLTPEDIVQIKTDSITFYTKPYHNIQPSKKIGGWKLGEYKESQGSIYDNSTPFTSFKQINHNKNTIYQGDAGNGKSYHIQHSDLTDAIILSSKHSAIRQHREKNLNAEVIQKYCAWNKSQKTKIPKESHIIIEECGILMKEHWDFIFKCFLLKKKITMYGDFKQLLPVDEIHTFNRPQWIDMIFSNQLSLDANWRNDFTADYYKSLYTSTDENYLKQEINKYSTKTPEEADVIIAYRNVIVDKYNNYMLAYHNKTIKDDIPLICKTNDLRDLNIYNNFIMNRNELDIHQDKIEKYFKPAYARTLYNMQGDEAKSYYVAPEDIHWFANPRMAYTLISRIAT